MPLEVSVEPGRLRVLSKNERDAMEMRLLPDGRVSSFRSFNGSKLRSEWEWRTLDAIGSRVASIRSSLRITQTELASFLSMPQSSYLRFELGESELPACTIYRLCYLFAVSPDELIGTAELETPELTFKCILDKNGAVVGTGGEPDGSPIELASATFGKERSDFAVTSCRSSDPESRPGRRRQNRTTMATSRVSFDDYMLGLLADRLAELRTAIGISQARMAEYLSIGVSTYQKYEGGATEMTALSACRLAILYGVTLSQLLGFKSIKLADKELQALLPSTSCSEAKSGDVPWSLTSGPSSSARGIWNDDELTAMDAHRASSYHHSRHLFRELSQSSPEYAAQVLAGFNESSERQATLAEDVTIRESRRP